MTEPGNSQPGTASAAPDTATAPATATNAPNSLNSTKKAKFLEKQLDRLIDYVRMCSKILESEKPMPTKQMVTYLQNHIPQFENFSYQSLAFLLQNSRIIDLYSRD